jgi:hypothetical protein
MHSFTAKLDRAYENFESFKQEVNSWVEAEPYVIVDEPNPNPPINKPADWLMHHRQFRLVSIDPVPERLSLIIGDCLFNARSALDHLAFALANKFTPNMTQAQITGSEFPITADAPMDARSEARKIGCIDPTAQTVIQALQPHHRGSDYRTHPLWRLHEFNRIDKHRLLTVVVAEPFATDPNGVRMKCVGFIGHDRMKEYQIIYAAAHVDVLEPDAVLFRYGVVNAKSPDDVKMQPSLSLEIAFGQTSPLPFEPAIPTLQATLDFVRDTVVAPLAKFL